MLWQTNRIKHHQRPRNKQRLQLLHLVPADPAADKAGMAVTVDMAAVADAAKAVQAVAAVDVVKVVDREDRAAVPVDLAAANGNFFARKKSASFVSKKWTSSITNAPTFFPNSCRNAARFFPVA
jgi:hypothetical protein